MTSARGGKGRDHARITPAIHRDPDWRALAGIQQWLYWHLLSRPEISRVGLLPLNVEKWAAGCADWDQYVVDDALSGLEKARFVVVDRDTYEVLVRSFMRNDRVYEQPNTMISATGAARNAESEHIRRALAVELTRIRAILPDSKLRTRVIEAIDATLSTLPTPDPPTPSRNPSGIPSGKGSGIPYTPDTDRPNSGHKHSSEYGMRDGIDDSAVYGMGEPPGDGVGVSSFVPVPEVETFPPSACPPRAHAHTRARGDHPPDPSEGPTTAPVVEAHRPIGVVPPEPVTYRHGDEASKGIDPDVARASTLTHGYLQAEPMALYERVQPVVLRAVRSGKYGHDDIATALGRLAADDRSVTVDTLRIELAGQPPARAAPRSRSGRSGSASAYLAAVTDDPEPDLEPWRSS